MADGPPPSSPVCNQHWLSYFKLLSPFATGIYHLCIWKLSYTYIFEKVNFILLDYSIYQSVLGTATVQSIDFGEVFNSRVSSIY